MRTSLAAVSAEGYLNEKWLKKLYVYEWKRECKETGKWTLPGAMVARYRGERLGLSPLDVTSGLLAAKSIKKGSLVLERSGALGMGGGK